MQKLRTIATFLCFLLPFVLVAQDITPAPAPDEGMEIFLLVFGTAFIAIMLGGAIIGAFAAALVLLVFFGFVATGIFSTALVVALARRSVTAGFKTLLVCILCPTGALFGLVGLHTFSRFFPLPFASLTLTITGLSAGVCGGLLLALFIWRILRLILVFAVHKIRG